MPWSAEQKEGFLRMQFQAQSTHYQAHYARQATFDVVLVDVALLPAFRGRGVGRRLLQAVLDEAAAGGKLTSIHVEFENPALRLYERLGFVKISEVGFSWLMHRAAP